MADAKELKEVARAKAKMPKGTHLVEEEDRIRTLDTLVVEKQEIERLLNQMPISMRTEALRKK
jgi:hypothetical protein